MTPSEPRLVGRLGPQGSPYTGLRARPQCWPCVREPKDREGPTVMGVTTPHAPEDRAAATGGDLGAHGKGCPFLGIKVNKKLVTKTRKISSGKALSGMRFGSTYQVKTHNQQRWAAEGKGTR